MADAIKARVRLDDIAALDKPSKDAITLPLYSPVQLRRGYNTLEPEVTASEWRLEGGTESRADGIHLPGGTPGLQSRFGLAPGSSLTFALRADGREIRLKVIGQEIAFAGGGKSIRVIVVRAEESLTVTAVSDDGAPVIRKLDLPVQHRGPTFLSLRLTGASEHPGAKLLSAMVRGPATLPLLTIE